jgi:hypothetical protein
MERWQDAHHFYKRIQVSDAALPQPEEYTEKVAKFKKEDFVKMLEAQNMQVTGVFGDYKLQPYDAAKSPRLIIIAKKG